MAKKKAAGGRKKTSQSCGTRKTEPKPKTMEDAITLKRHRQAYAVVLFAASILMFCLVLVTGDNIWRWFHNILLGLFGNCAIIWPVLLIYISIVTAMEKQSGHTGSELLQIIIVITLFCASVYIFSIDESTGMSYFWKKLTGLYKDGIQHYGGGFFSGLLGIPITAALGLLGAKIVIILALFVSIMILTGTGLIQLFRTVTRPAGAVKSNIDSARKRRIIENNRNETKIDMSLSDGLPGHPVSSPGKKGTDKKSDKLKRLEKVFAIDGKDEKKTKETDKAPAVRQSDDKIHGIPLDATQSGNVKNEHHAEAETGAVKPQEASAPPQDGSYHYPPVSMLEITKELSEQDVITEIQTNGRRLVETLKSFGVKTSFVGYSRGPSVTRYELQPASGVKISKITNLSDDLSMNLATSGIRIEAPIPGKAAVGIEVPNKKNTVVRMRELIESNAFVSSKSKLTVALGRDIAGGVAVADLSKMPHLLIAGSTGSGKSVCINSMIISLLYKSTPDEVRFLMIDPKVVELGIYNGIPHLLVPVVTDPRKAAGALNWAVSEMLNRYKIFAANNVRDLKAYNSLAASRDFKTESGEPMEHMPQIVIIIDELADLMMAAPNEVEDAICRLAQMARAAGMHLVIATQRPSVDVITGIIKANIPSRIAFAVSSQVDSRTILDMSGAEKLLGRGDMLFSPVGSQKPTRIQGSFVSDSEIESITGFVKKTQEADYSENIAEEIEKNAVEEKGKGKKAEENQDLDPMMDEAIKCIVECGQASTSLLQRRLRLGYARAGRIIDQMEQLGIVGPHDGSKPRKILITYNQWLERNMQKADSSEKESG